MMKGVLAFAFMIASAIIWSGSARSQGASTQWVGAWAASAAGTLDPMTLQNFTVRQTVIVSTDGTQYSIKLSNELSAASITIGAVQASLPGNAPGTINTGLIIPVLFGGQSNITIPAHASVVSDAISLPLYYNTNLTISIYVFSATVGPTFHALGSATTFIAPGNQTGFASLTGAAIYTFRPILAGINLLQTARATTIVAIGDSITDGFGSSINTNHRWPDFLAARLRTSALPIKPSVVNAGISGNQLLADNPANGPSLLARLPGDAFAVPGIKYLCVLIGINDIHMSAATGSPVTASQIISGYLQIIGKARQANIKVFLATITPSNNYFLHTAANEFVRTQVNSWIRARQGFDGVLDFDAALRNPAVPSQILPAYDSGDHLHPNDLGYLAMANAIDLSLFQP